MLPVRKLDLFRRSRSVSLTPTNDPYLTITGTIIQLGKVNNCNENVRRLHEAALCGHKNVVLEVLQFDLWIDYPNDAGQTVLFIATFQGHYNVVETLLQKRANPNEKSNLGITPLHVACCKGSARIVLAMISAGGDLRLHDNKGNTCLDFAACHSNLRKGKQIMDLLKKAQLFALKIDNHCVLEEKALNSQTSLMKLLRDKFSSPISINGPGKSVLYAHEACNYLRPGNNFVYGMQSVIPIVKNSDLNVDPNGYTVKLSAQFTMTHMLWKETKVSAKGSGNHMLKDYTDDLLIKEVEFLSKLRHANVLILMGICQTDCFNRTVLLLERVNIGSIHWIVHDKGLCFPIKYIHDIAVQVCEAMIYIHEQSYLHCCLTSHAIFLVSSHYVKLGELQHMMDMTRATAGRISTAVSYPHREQYYRWLCPETLDGQPPTPSSDIFSFCCVLWEMIFSELPFSTYTVDSLTNLYHTKNFKLPTVKCVTMFQCIIDMGLSFEPQKRPKSFHEILNNLHGHLEKPPWWKLLTHINDITTSVHNESTERITLKPVPTSFCDESMVKREKAGDEALESIKIDCNNMVVNETAQPEVGYKQSHQIDYDVLNEHMSASYFYKEQSAEHSSQDNGRHIDPEKHPSISHIYSISNIHSCNSLNITHGNSSAMHSDRSKKYSKHLQDYACNIVDISFQPVLCTSEVDLENKHGEEDMNLQMTVDQVDKQVIPACDSNLRQYTSEIINASRFSKAIPTALTRHGSHIAQLSNTIKNSQSNTLSSCVYNSKLDRIRTLSSKRLPLMKPASHITGIEKLEMDERCFSTNLPLPRTMSTPSNGFKECAASLSNNVGNSSCTSANHLSKEHKKTQQDFKDTNLSMPGCVQALTGQFQTHLDNRFFRRKIVRDSMVPSGSNTFKPSHHLSTARSNDYMSQNGTVSYDLCKQHENNDLKYTTVDKSSHPSNHFNDIGCKGEVNYCRSIAVSSATIAPLSCTRIQEIPKSHFKYIGIDKSSISQIPGFNQEVNKELCDFSAMDKMSCVSGVECTKLHHSKKLSKTQLVSSQFDFQDYYIDDEYESSTEDISHQLLSKDSGMHSVLADNSVQNFDRPYSLNRSTICTPCNEGNFKTQDDLWNSRYLNNESKHNIDEHTDGIRWSDCRERVYNETDDDTDLLVLRQNFWRQKKEGYLADIRRLRYTRKWRDAISILNKEKKCYRAKNIHGSYKTESIINDKTFRKAKHFRGLSSREKPSNSLERLTDHEVYNGNSNFYNSSSTKFLCDEFPDYSYFPVLDHHDAHISCDVNNDPYAALRDRYISKSLQHSSLWSDAFNEDVVESKLSVPQLHLEEIDNDHLSTVDECRSHDNVNSDDETIQPHDDLNVSRDFCHEGKLYMDTYV